MFRPSHRDNGLVYSDTENTLLTWAAPQITPRPVSPGTYQACLAFVSMELSKNSLKFPLSQFAIHDFALLCKCKCIMKALFGYHFWAFLISISCWSKLYFCNLGGPRTSQAKNWRHIAQRNAIVFSIIVGTSTVGVQSERRASNSVCCQYQQAVTVVSVETSQPC